RLLGIPLSDSALDENALDALQAIERFATPSYTAAAKYILYRSTTAFGIKPPNLTYGPLRLRFSRFVRYHSGADAGIFNLCDAERAAANMIEDQFGPLLTTRAPLSRRELIEVVKFFNGQVTRDEGKNIYGALANGIYNEIVYHIYEEARFDL